MMTLLQYLTTFPLSVLIIMALLILFDVEEGGAMYRRRQITFGIFVISFFGAAPLWAWGVLQ